MSDIQIRQRIDGKHEQRLGGRFMAERFEGPETGPWRAEVLLEDEARWVSIDHQSMEETGHAALSYVSDSDKASAVIEALTAWIRAMAPCPEGSEGIAGWRRQEDDVRASGEVAQDMIAVMEPSHGR